MSYLNDLADFNERYSSLVPFVKQDLAVDTIDLLLSEKTGSTSRRRSSVLQAMKPILENAKQSMDTDVFELEMNETSDVRPLPSPKVDSLPEVSGSGWHVVSTRKPSFASSPRPTTLFPATPPSNGLTTPKTDSSSVSRNGTVFSSVTPSRASPDTTESMFPKLGEWNTPRRPSSNKENPWGKVNKVEVSPISPITIASPPSSNLSKSLKNMDLNGTATPQLGTSKAGEEKSPTSNAHIKTKPVKTAKMSQRERRKLQMEECKAEPVFKSPSEPSASGNPWKVAPTSVKKSTPSMVNVLADPFSAYSSKTPTRPSSSASIPPTTSGGLTEIIQQEYKRVEIKTAERSKGLKEIQQEEEFAKWWAEESAKVQAEQQLIQDLANPQSSKKKSNNNNQKNKAANGGAAGKKKAKPPRRDSAVTNTNSQGLENSESPHKNRPEGGPRYRGGASKGKGKVKQENIKV